jgi:hypothetical protein
MFSALLPIQSKLHGARHYSHHTPDVHGPARLHMAWHGQTTNVVVWHGAKCGAFSERRPSMESQRGEQVGFRQICAMQPRLNVKPLADEVTAIISERRKDHRVQWYRDGQVRVVVSEVIPRNGVANQTLSGRRRRFREALTERLRPAGWESCGFNRYRSALQPAATAEPISVGV